MLALNPPQRPARILASAASLALAFAASAAPAQAPATDPFDVGVPFVRAYQVSDGLPQNTIHSLMLDRRGLLWAGTQDGAARYDGRSWTDVELPTRERSNFVRTLLESSNGDLWIGTQAGGLLRRRGEDWRVFGGDSEGAGDLRINVLAESPGGADGPLLWAGTHANGLARFDGRAWRRWTVAEGLPADRVWDLLPVDGPDGPRLWLATEGGVAYIELPDGPVVVPAGAPSESASSLELLPRDAGRTPEVWVGLYGGGLARHADGHWRRYGAPDGLTSTFVTDLARRPGDPRALWVATDGGGLLLFENELLRNVDLGTALSSRAIYRVLETTAQQGAAAVWIGTRNNGLLRLMGGYWRSFVPFPEIPRSTVSALMVPSRSDSEPEVWLGTDGFGVATWREGEWRRFGVADGALGHDSVLAIVESRAVGRGRLIWVGTRNGGLSAWDGVRWRRHDRASGALPNDLVQTLLETVDPQGRGTLWVGTREGLASYDGERWQQLDATAGWPVGSVLALLEERDPAGRSSLWIGTSNGLYRRREGELRHWADADGMPNSTVHALHLRRGAGGKRELWVGTDGGGVVVLDPDDTAARPRPLSDLGVARLPNGVVYSILEDRAGRFYLPSNRGVIRITRAADADAPADVELLTVEHGLPSSQASRGAGAVDALGRIWVGTVDGAAALDPAREPGERAPKKILLDGTIADGSGRDVAAGSRLDHDDDRVLFHYTLLSFFGEPLTRYRTQLAGHEESPTAWTAAGEREFAGIPAGDYIFRVWGRDASGRVSGPEELAFAVLPAPWQTLGARLAVFALAALAVIGLVMARARVHERRERELEELVAARTARLQRANALLIELSYVDAVTAIPNRRRFDELLAAEWKRAVRARAPLGLVMIDIDRFKGFNDSQGHQRGDDCLRQVAATLADGLSRSGDAIARYGGEEFALVLPATDLEGAVRVAEQLRKRVLALAIPNPASDIAEVVTVSCGVAATVPEAANGVEGLLAAADRALYEAKKNGRNRIAVTDG